MVGTIAPLVQVARRQWLVSTGVFVVASVAGGGIVGWSLGGVGAITLGAQHLQYVGLVLGFLAAVLALIEVQLLPLGVPTLYRSVPQHWWIQYGPTKAALAYGFVLGMGVTTFIPFASFYLLLAGAILLGPEAGGLILASYGLGRAVPVPIASLVIAQGVSPVTIGRWAFGTRRQLAKRLCALALLAVAIGFPAASLGG